LIENRRVAFQHSSNITLTPKGKNTSVGRMEMQAVAHDYEAAFGHSRPPTRLRMGLIPQRRPARWRDVQRLCLCPDVFQNFADVSAVGN
jgi:hypothetical protein